MNIHYVFIMLTI